MKSIYSLLRCPACFELGVTVIQLDSVSFLQSNKISEQMIVKFNYPDLIYAVHE